MTLQATRSWIVVVAAVILQSFALDPADGFLLPHPSSHHNMIRTTGRLYQTITESNPSMEALLSLAREIGPVGSLASEESQAQLLDMARQLTLKGNDATPSQTSLRGIHELVYSAAKGGSSGLLFGPVYGKVTQNFLEDDTTFINAVQLGPLKITLQAEKTIKNDETNIVTFRQIKVSLFGQTVVDKETKGGGTWKYLYMGTYRNANGKLSFLRVFETPSLFIVEQPIAE